MPTSPIAPAKTNGRTLDQGDGGRSASASTKVVGVDPSDGSPTATDVPPAEVMVDGGSPERSTTVGVESPPDGGEAPDTAAEVDGAVLEPNPGEVDEMVDDVVVEDVGVDEDVDVGVVDVVVEDVDVEVVVEDVEVVVVEEVEVGASTVKPVESRSDDAAPHFAPPGALHAQTT